MPLIPPGFYADWRVRCGAVSVLREDRESPPERLLQAVWQNQRLLRDQLATLDGQAVRILHPGFRSVEGGPDFRGAVIQFADTAPRTGDVEVDLRSSGWRAHGHDRNPAFRNVILHVIWDGARTEGTPPALPLHATLDAPLGELSLWLGDQPAPPLSEEMLGRCSAPLRELPKEKLLELLNEAALVRLQGKAAQFHARARQVGWQQALWEGVFRALGYKHNVWPMQRLAELRPRWHAQRAQPLVLQSRLLGISGLLPDQLTRTQSAGDNYVRRVWDHWWREREEFSDCILPRDVWHFHGLRPVNHPQRRLALASRWSEAGDLAQKLERWCTRKIPDAALTDSLLETFQVERDDFWSWHYTLRSSRLNRAQPLLGAPRVTDLAVNVVLPWLWTRASEGKNTGVQHTVESRYFAWPAAEDNSVLRLARQRLLGGASRRALPTAAAQQGLIQMVRDFCDHSNALCEKCRLPGLVRAFA